MSVQSRVIPDRLMAKVPGKGFICRNIKMSIRRKASALYLRYGNIKLDRPTSVVAITVMGVELFDISRSKAGIQEAIPRIDRLKFNLFRIYLVQHNPAVIVKKSVVVFEDHHV